MMTPQWYFGDASDHCKDQGVYRPTAIRALRERLGARRLVLADQKHETQGLFVEDLADNDAEIIGGLRSTGPYADIVLTTTPQTAVGVFTGDCLPVLLYDSRNAVVAAVHAGWRGAVAGIIDRALALMRYRCGTLPADVRAIFGPCAQACCYEVGDMVLQAAARRADYHMACVYKNNTVYFDVAMFVMLDLLDGGVAREHIDLRQTLCTMCTARFCSARRQKAESGRQVSVIWFS